MKLLNWILITASVLFASCDDNNYVITGTAVKERPHISGTIDPKGYESGMVYLLKPIDENKFDTIQAVRYQNNRFEFKGEIDSCMFALIQHENSLNAHPVWLEKGRYTAIIHGGDGFPYSYISGPEYQTLYNEYMSVSGEQQGRYKGFSYRYDIAEEEGDTKEMKKIEKEYENSLEDEKTKILNLIKKHPSHPVTIDHIFSCVGDYSVAYAKKVYACLPKTVQQGDCGKALMNRVNILEAMKVGNKAPNFKIKDANGKEISLYDVKGKIKIIDFWASWCAPCRKEFPKIKKIYEKFHDKGLEIIGVSLDNSEKSWKKAIEKEQLSWINVSELKGWKSEVVKKYNVKAVPALFILDGNNKIIEMNIHGSSLEALLGKYLK